LQRMHIFLCNKRTSASGNRAMGRATCFPSLTTPLLNRGIEKEAGTRTESGVGY